MSRFEKLRDKKATRYISLSGPEIVRFNMSNDFKNGWDSCSEQYEIIIKEYENAIINLIENWAVAGNIFCHINLSDELEKLRLNK